MVWASLGGRWPLNADVAQAERTQSNNGMHPTRDTAALMYINLAGGRVMPGVGLPEWGIL
jgi:hypothetical protein